jgi:hypothetical protein
MSMSPAEFEPTIPANEQPQINALGGAAAGIGIFLHNLIKFTSGSDAKCSNNQ